MTEGSAGESRGTHVLYGKGAFQTKLRFVDVKGGCDLGDFERQITAITIYKIPAICLKLVMDVLDESGWSIEPQRLFSPNQNSQ
jgi:hypothetical protein